MVACYDNIVGPVIIFSMLDEKDLKSIGALMDEKLEHFGVEVDEKLSNLDQKIDKKFQVFEQKFDEKLLNLDQKFDRKLSNLDQKLNRKFDEKLDEVLMVVNQGFSEMQGQFRKMNDRIDTLYKMIDGFVHLHQKLDQELTMLRNRIDHLEEKLIAVQAKHA